MFVSFDALAQKYTDIELSQNAPKKKSEKTNTKLAQPTPTKQATQKMMTTPSTKGLSLPPSKPLPTTEPALSIPTQPLPKAPAAKASSSNELQLSDDILEPNAKFKNRHGLLIDYSTWYEVMKVKSKENNSLMEANTHYFGVGISYDYTYYRENYGLAFTIGYVTGNAQAGTKDSGDYYEKRVPWSGYRGGGRLFYRANNRIDLGFGFLAQTKQTKWPEGDAFTAVAQANPQYFYYLDTRWRLNYRLELVQSFGAHLRSTALAWLLGINCTLN